VLLPHAAAKTMQTEVRSTSVRMRQRYGRRSPHDTDERPMFEGRTSSSYTLHKTARATAAYS